MFGDIWSGTRVLSGGRGGSWVFGSELGVDNGGKGSF